MPAPFNAAGLIDLVRRSGVADEERLSAYLEPLTAAGALPDEPTKLAGLLVRDGIITFFQAEQLLQGKWKRFNIGKYRVLERLGSGGMGQVFLCEHKLMRRRVAIKVLPAARAEDPAALERFYREARAVAALDHPNLVRAFDIDRDQALHFLVMEYVEGVSLQDLVRKFGPLDPLRACHYVKQAAVGLCHAFRVAGLIHRDIKPANVLVDRQGCVKIFDMGLARFFNDESDVLTRKYDENVLGTADYLAPEQALDSHSVDIRADIYSLGGTLYFILTGRPPFPDGTIAQKLIWHQTREPQPVRELRPEVPQAVAAIVQRMMQKLPDGRYQTPAQVIDALAPLTGESIPPPSEREMPLLSLAAMSGSGQSSITARLRRPMATAGSGHVPHPDVPGPPAERPPAPTAAPPAEAATSPGGGENPFTSLLAPAADDGPGDSERVRLQSVYSAAAMARPRDDSPARRGQAVWAFAAGATVFAAVTAAGYWLWNLTAG